MCNEHNAPCGFEKIRQKHPELNRFVVHLLSERRTPKEAICLPDIKFLYVIQTIRPFPKNMCTIRATEYILTIPNIVCFRNHRGVPHFYSLR